MADVGTTTRVGIRTRSAAPGVAASGPTPGTPNTDLGQFARAQATAATADYGVTDVRFLSQEFLHGTPPSAPVFGFFSPGAGTINRAASVSFAVECPEGFAMIFVWAVLPDLPSVLVYDGTGFGADLDDGSSVTGSTTKSFTIAYNGDGWPADYTLYVTAISTSGLTTSISAVYTLADPPDPPDSTSPTVTLVSPPVGSRLLRGTPVVLDVTDASGLAAVFLWVTYASAFAPDDLVHDGENFSVQFRDGSTREAIAGGYRYTLRRGGGWPSAPTVHVRPIDAEGNAP